MGGGRYWLRGTAGTSLGDDAGAVADYDRAIELNSKCFEALARRGLARAWYGDKSGCKQDFEAALKYAPKDWSEREEIEKMLKTFD